MEISLHNTDIADFVTVYTALALRNLPRYSFQQASINFSCIKKLLSLIPFLKDATSKDNVNMKVSLSHRRNRKNGSTQQPAMDKIHCPTQITVHIFSSA